MIEKDISAKEVFAYVFKAVAQFKTALFVIIFANILWAIDVSLKPYIIKIITNRIHELPTSEVAEGLLVPACAYIALSFLMMTNFRINSYFVQIKMIPELRKKIAVSGFKSLLQQIHHFYQNNFAGSLASRINSLIDVVPDFWQLLIDRCFANGLCLCVAICTLWNVNLSFALAAVIWCIIFISTSFFFSSRLTKLSENFSEKGSKIIGKFVDAFSNILFVRLFARNNYEEKSLEKAINEAVEAERKVEWFNFWMWGIGSYSFVVIQSVSIYFLITYLEKNLVTVGDFVLVLTLNGVIVDCLWGFARDFSKFSRLFGKITQGLKSVKHITEIIDKLEAINMTPNIGRIQLNSISFHYPSSTPLFQDLSLTIKAGTKTGLVGKSGSGKSTFVNLILRLYDVTDGSITIDGNDIRDVTQDSLRQNIAMIPQDPSLFHRSLMDNIRYGRIDALDDEVIEAAKKAHAHEFIEKLPEGYNSLVGERGVKLSGGQRQRIAIARAILKDAPILILDEATSQLDSVTESYIQQSLLELMQSDKGKTTIVIAHRLSTLLSMDRILVFDKGRIVQNGTHDQLLAKDGLYKQLWDAQVGGFLGGGNDF